MTTDLETDFEARAQILYTEAQDAIESARQMLAIDDSDSVGYLRDAIDAIRSAEGWRAAAQAVSDQAVKEKP